MTAAPRRPILVGAIAASILGVSTAAILIRVSTAPPLAIAFYRLFYATLLLAPFGAWYARREIAALTARDWLGLAAVGAVLAIHFASWITSLGLTSVASSVFLVTLHPVFVAAVSKRVYGEGVTAWGFAGIALALVGGIVITLGDARSGPSPLLGDALALVGALCAAIYFLAGRGYRKRLSLLAYVLPVYASCAVVLAILLVVMPAPYGGSFGGYGANTSLPFADAPALQQQAIFVALALVPMILGHTVLNWALKHVTAPVIATTILGEPVGSTALAFLLLHEAPPLAGLAGGALVLVGIGTVAVTSARVREIPEEVPT